MTELAGCVIFGIVAGSLGALAMSTSMSDREQKYQRDQLREFLKSKRINIDMQKEVLDQMENWWARKSVFDERLLLDRLPPKHRKQLLMKMYRPSLVKSPLLKGVDDAILAKLCMVMRPYLALSGDEIIREGDVGEEMYILITGTIKLSSGAYPAYTRRNWTNGAFFGELTVLKLGGGPQQNRHVYSVEAVEDSDCSFLSESALVHLFDLQLAGQTTATLEDRMRDLAIQRAERFGHFSSDNPNTNNIAAVQSEIGSTSADSEDRIVRHSNCK